MNQVPDDFTEFMKLCSKKFSPLDFQMMLGAGLMRPGNVCIRSARQMGVTTIIAMFALWSAIRLPGQRIAIVVPKHAAIDEIKKKILICNPGGARTPWCNGAEAQVNIIFPGNRHPASTIEFFSGSGSIRGKPAYDLIILDDMNLYRHDLENAMREFLARNPCAKIIAATGPTSTADFYYTLANSNAFREIVLPWYVNPIFDETHYKQLEKALGEELARIEAYAEVVAYDE